MKLFSVVGLLVALAACSSPPPKAAPPSTTSTSQSTTSTVATTTVPTTAAPTTTTPTTTTAAAAGVPADMLNPKVSPGTIGQTICVSGYTTTIRPSSSYTTALKRHQLQSYGYTDQNLSDYEEDHAIPLELGGAPSAPANLWPQPHDTSFSDDGQETSLKDSVCAHRLALADAQQRIYGLKLAAGYRRAASLG